MILIKIIYIKLIRLSGKDATKFLLKLTPSDVKGLSYTDGIYSSTLSVLMNEQGGILDDLIITRHGDSSYVTIVLSMNVKCILIFSTRYYLVTNAARREHDVAWIKSKIAEWGMDVKFELDDSHGLLAFQGVLF